MKNRREFLKEAATGAVLLGSSSTFALAGSLSRAEQHAGAGKSKVVIARDPSLHGQSTQPQEQRVQNLLDHAMATYTGRDPKDAWKQVIAMGQAQDKVIGLKVNGLGGKGIATHPALILAVAERLQQAGVKPGNILVWDQNPHFLEGCGMTVNTDPSRMRCYSSAEAGFEDQESAWGVARIRITKILTRECAMVINLPILKDHSMAGVTFALKNMYGVVDRPFTLHADNCNPAVADLNAIPVFREKIRLTIGDAISSVYEGGPGFHPEHLWYPNALIVGEDRVAIDHTAWGLLEKKRAEIGMPTFEAAGRPPRYIATAADETHHLGTNDPKRINLVEV
ncbi:MAG TPA: DUF362 domain-containing protein [Terracidiphilus sp.]|jgi:uncharacterized protein (DUF362 family)|nr:DUF362 domain-containing protein [Terracidiphilus sp.]